MNYTKTSKEIAFAATAALVCSSVIAATYFVFEPLSTQAVDSEFIVTQQITGEIAFLVEPADVAMTDPAASIGGITGGQSNGATTAVVKTNNAAGYNMTISFEDANAGSAAQHAMKSNSVVNNDVINNYSPTGTTDYDFANNPTGGAAEFGYSVAASSTADLNIAFKHSGTTCGSGTTATLGKCWAAPLTTSQEIINRSTPAGTGATTTISFHVNVPSSPSPTLSADTYTATATLTATTN